MLSILTAVFLCHKCCFKIRLVVCPCQLYSGSEIFAGNRGARKRQLRARLVMVACLCKENHITFEISRIDVNSRSSLQKVGFLPYLKIFCRPEKLFWDRTLAYFVAASVTCKKRGVKNLKLVSYYDIILLYSRNHLKWINLYYCDKPCCQNYL